MEVLTGLECPANLGHLTRVSPVKELYSSDDLTESGGRGGYDAEFNPAPESRYVCPICMLVLRDPVQTNCGHRYCRYCLFKWLRHSSVCPACKCGIHRSETFSDNYAKREILGFAVHCPNRKNGCDVTMELREVEKHQADVCLYVYCVCPKGCSQTILKKNLQSHIENTCPANRSFTCEFCACAVSVADRQSHSNSCQDQKQPCKFCSEIVRKSEMSLHLKNSCSSVVIQCKFHHFGCTERCERQRMNMHVLRSLPDHLELLAQFVLKSEQITDPKISSFIQMLALSDKELHPLSSSKLFSRSRSSTKDFTASPDVAEPEERRTPGATERLNFRSHEVQSLAADCRIKSTSGKEEEEEEGSSRAALVRRVAEQEKKLVECNEYIKRLEHTIYDLGTRNSHGAYIWKIPDFRRKLQEAKSNKNSVLYSPGFYSSYYGYKTCIRVHLNGTGSAWGQHLSVFIHFMPGEFDDILQWPFHGRITLSVLDQNDNFKLREDVQESMEPNPLLEAFERPRESRNHKGFGYLEFLPLSTLLGSSYIKSDALYIKATVTAT